MDLADNHLLWIADMALTAPLPKGWKHAYVSRDAIFLWFMHRNVFDISMCRMPKETSSFSTRKIMPALMSILWTKCSAATTKKSKKRRWTCACDIYDIFWWINKKYSKSTRHEKLSSTSHSALTGHFPYALFESGIRSGATCRTNTVLRPMDEVLSALEAMAIAAPN